MTDTDYNQIADEYKASKLLPWRGAVEAYTLLQLAGDVRGKKVLDVACGEGHYARRLRQGGAVVTGVDASQGMIDLARAEEARNPLGITYRVQDARALQDTAEYDLVLAAWLFNYARDADELTAMAMPLARALKPGGRLVAVNTNPDDRSHNTDALRQYGIRKRAGGGVAGEALREGAEIVWTLTLEDGELDIVNYHLTRVTVTSCLQDAGFRDVRWYAPRLEPAEDCNLGEWQALLDAAPFVFIECVT